MREGASFPEKLVHVACGAARCKFGETRSRPAPQSAMYKFADYSVSILLGHNCTSFTLISCFNLHHGFGIM